MPPESTVTPEIEVDFEELSKRLAAEDEVVVETGLVYRRFPLKVRAEEANDEERTIPIAFSSEEPVEMPWGLEILGHGKGEVRLERLQKAGAVLWNHDPDVLLGFPQNIEIGADRVGRAVVRFKGTKRALEEYEEAKNGDLPYISVGYAVHRMVLVEENDEGPNVYRITDWEPYEVSFVSMPADISVGVGRSVRIATRICHQSKPQEGSRNMPPEVPAAPPAAPPEPPAPATPPIDLDAERNSWRETQRRMHEDMRALAEQHKAKVPGATELALKYISEGKSLDELGSAFLERHVAAKPVDPSAAYLGMDEKDKKRWSFGKVFSALTRPNDRRAQEAAAFEREVSEEYAKKVGREFKGFALPLDVMVFQGRMSRDMMAHYFATRDLVVGTASAGGNLKGTDLLGASFIDVLRASNPIVADAMVLTGVTGDIAIPRHSAATQAYWVGEGVAPTEGAPTFDQVTGSPKTIAAYLDLSRKLRIQSSIDIEEFALMDLAMALGIAISTAAINGSGTGAEPTGILGTSGIGDVAGGTNGAAPTWVNISNIKKEVAKDNALRGVPRWYLNSDTIGKLEQTERFSGSGYPILDPDRGGQTMAGYGWRETNLVPNDLDKGTSTGVCSAILFAVMQDLILPFWTGVDITVDEASLSTVGGLRIVAMQDTDVLVRHAESFSAMQDALTT